MVVYFVVSYILALYNSIFIGNYMMSIAIGLFTTIFIVYTNKFTKRTKETNLEYKKWMAFIKYIKKPDNTFHEADSSDIAKLYGDLLIKQHNLNNLTIIIDSNHSNDRAIKLDLF